MRISKNLKLHLGAACLGALASLAAGCGGGDTVRLRGHIYHADGTPAAGLALDSGALLGDDGVVAAQTTTDASGGYELVGTPQRYAAFEGAYVDVNLGLGTLGTVHVRHRGDTTDVPDVYLWDDGLALTEAPEGGFSLTWKDPADRSATLELIAGNEVAGGFVESWREPLLDKPFVLAGEMLEDRAAGIVLEAGLPTGAECTEEVCVTLRSHIVRTSGPGSSAPASRFARCTATTASAAALPLTVGNTGGCPLTDGTFATPFGPPPEWSCGTAPCEPVTAVTVDLGETTVIHRVVVRAIDTTDSAFVEVESSEDGTSFTGIAQIYDGYSDVAPVTPRSARYVRLSVPAGAIVDAAEVSVF